MSFFDYISMPFGYLMRFCCWISPGNNYLIALIYFTVIIQLLLCLLFGIKQQKNMIKQASIAPMAAALRKKYQGRDDPVTRQKMQQETMELYQQYGYSPLSGCLPMFIQLPIIMSLYNVIVAPLQNMFMLANDKIDTLIKGILPYCNINDPANSMLSVEALEQLSKRSQLAQIEVLKLAKNGQLDVLTGDAGQIADELKSMSQFFPNYNAFGFDFSVTPPYPNAENFKELWPLIFIPVLIVVTMIASQMLSKKFTYQDPTMQQQQSGCSMKVMMYSMPLLSASISFSMPAAVGVYWIYRSIVSTIQQFILYLVMPLPKFTEEDYKKAEKEMAGTSKKSQKKSSEGTTKKVGRYAYNEDGTVKRSLHHIDEEDETPPPAPQKNADDEKLADGVDPADAPVMKDDRSADYKKKH